MAFSLCWIAVRGPTREAVLEALGLEPHRVSGYRRQELGDLRGGWLLYVDSHYGRGFGKPLERIVALGAPTVACRQEDHVMHSEARGYESGREIWRVVRDPDEGPDTPLIVTGRPPQPFETIRARAIAAEEGETEDEDYADVILMYDVPLELGRAIFGFRPGETKEPELTPLRPARSAVFGGFFARLFGRG